MDGSMSEEMKGSIGRSVLALLVGAIAVVALSIGTDLLLEKNGYMPKPGEPLRDGPLAVALVYRVIYGVLGSYLAALGATEWNEARNDFGMDWIGDQYFGNDCDVEAGASMVCDRAGVDSAAGRLGGRETSGEQTGLKRVPKVRPRLAGKL